MKSPRIVQFEQFWDGPHAKPVRVTESNRFKSVSEVLKTGAAIAKNPGTAVDIVKTGVEVVKKGVQILPNPKDFKDLAKLVEAASSGK